MDFLADVDFASLSEAIDSVELLEINGTWLEEELKSEESTCTSPVSVTPPPAKKKRTDMRGYSTRLMQRKKAELAHLRNEESELTAWLEQLKNSILTAQVSSGNENPPGPPSKEHKEWVARALEEFRRRKRAEVVNRKLKAIQADQAQIQKALLDIIERGSNRQEQNFVFAMPRTLLETHENAAVFAKLRDQTGVLFQDLPPINPDQQTVYNSSFETITDTNHGKMFQSSTLSVVPCSMKTAGDVLWLEYLTPRKFPFKSYRYANVLDTNSGKKSFDFLLQTRNHFIPINGLMFARKFDEIQRVTMVRAYTALFPTAGLRLRCNHWTIISPSDQGCCVWFFAQLYTEQQAGFTASPKDIKFVEEVALETWSLKMHFYSQHLLDMLMVKAEA